MVKPIASIIIITKNQRRFLKKSLPAIFSQTVKNGEVIVVDSGTKEDNRDLFTKYPVKHIAINPKTFNYARAFNTGAAKAKGEFLVRLSGDAIPKNAMWLENLLRNFTNEKVAGVYSRWINTKDASIFDKYLVFFSMPKQKLIFAKEPNWNGASGALRRKLWEKYPFDTTLPFCEDWDWSRKVQEAGYLIIYEPSSIVYHSHKENLWQFLLRGYRTLHALKKIYIG